MYNEVKILSLATITLAALAAGCSERPPSLISEEAPAKDLPAAGTAGAGDAVAPPAGLHGSVLETMEAGGYTYALLDTGSEKVWVAAPPIELAIGDEVEAPGAMLMRDFHSSSLDRTFDVVHFAPEIIHAGQATPGGMPAGHGTPKTRPVEATTDFARIDRAEGGVTVEEVFLRKDELIDTGIAVRGKVVKYNGEILGKNWLHLQDGTGSAGTNDLTITTDATCAVGDTVVVRGKLVADRDFGAGYVYALIIEDAQVTVE